MSASRVEQLAAAVADGDSVDWESAQSLLDSDADRAIATQLRGLSSLSACETAVDVVAAARLPLLLRVTKTLALLKCLLGVAGYVVTWSLEGKGAPPIFLLGIGVFAGAAVWLDITGRGDRRAGALAGVYWTSAASFSHDLMYALSGLTILPVDLTWLRGFQPEAFFPLFLWQFARDFPNVTRFGAVDRLSRVGVVLAGCAAVTLFVVNVASRVLADSLPFWLSVFDRSVDRGRWFWMVVFVAAIAALAWVLVRGELAEGKERTRVRLFLWTIAAAIAPVAVLVLIESTLPSFGSFMRTGVGRTLGAVLVYPPMFAFPVVTSYVVLAHDVLDVTAVAQRTLRYLLTRWLVAWGTSVPIAILAIVFYLHRAEPLTSVLSTPHARLLLWLAVAGAVVLALRSPLLRALDRWMLNGISDPAGTLAELGGELRNARTLMELSAVVAGAVERTMQTDVDVYFIEEDGALICATDTSGLPRYNSLVPVLLQGAGGPCIVESRGRRSYYGLLAPEDRRWIQREGIMALCPIVPSGAGRVRAMIALKARRNALGLSRADVQFLTAVCSAAALAHIGLEQMTGRVTQLQEELGLQCSECSRVESWRPDSVRCECGGRWDRAALPDVVSGRFKLESLLGAGGMGVVYKARDLMLHRSVAVKTLPRLAPEAAERLLDEARAMAALSHAHIAILYGAEQWRGTPVLMVEFLEGGTLAHRLRGGQLSIDTAFEIAIALAETLEYMHGTNRYHGDIKPSNIGFTAQGVAKFLDFGLSRTVQDDGGEDRPTGGTVAYLSPEVLDGAMPGSASDVWALSVVLFQSLAGYHPFLRGADTSPRIRAGIRDPGRLRAGLAAPVADLLCELLNVAPGVRPLDATAFKERVQRVQFSLLARSQTVES